VQARSGLGDTGRLEQRCRSFLQQRLDTDPAHDLSHVERVVQNTRRLTRTEGGRALVTIPAAWLHDCVAVPKDSPLRARASSLAAAEALKFLPSAGYPNHLLEAVRHAIEAHSFSAAIPPRTLEARIVQDADRLEALGAIGISRCLLTGGSLGTPLYDTGDPFAENRTPDDRRFTLDHFYCKLLGLAATMQTAAGRAEAARRTEYMKTFLAQLREEIGA